MCTFDRKLSFNSNGKSTPLVSGVGQGFGTSHQLTHFSFFKNNWGPFTVGVLILGQRT